MARPSIKHGYARVANELLEALASHAPEFSGYEMAVILWVLRATYGVAGNPEYVEVRATDLAAALGLNARLVQKTLSRLLERGVLRLSESSKGRRRAFGFVKDYDRWLDRDAEAYRSGRFAGVSFGTFRPLGKRTVQYVRNVQSDTPKASHSGRTPPSVSVQNGPLAPAQAAANPGTSGARRLSENTDKTERPAGGRERVRQWMAIEMLAEPAVFDVTGDPVAILSALHGHPGLTGGQVPDGGVDPIEVMVETIRRVFRERRDAGGHAPPIRDGRGWLIEGIRRLYPEEESRAWREWRQREESDAVDTDVVPGGAARPAGGG